MLPCSHPTDAGDHPCVLAFLNTPASAVVQLIRSLP
jgi:hypothetical protein